jgi:hypothetical protein
MVLSTPKILKKIMHAKAHARHITPQTLPTQASYGTQFTLPTQQNTLQTDPSQKLLTSARLANANTLYTAYQYQEPRSLLRTRSQGRGVNKSMPDFDNITNMSSKFITDVVVKYKFKDLLKSQQLKSPPKVRKIPSSCGNIDILKKDLSRGLESSWKSKLKIFH